jgi:hypothetical protein
MEDDPSLIDMNEPIAFNYDDNQNSLYYLGDQGAEIELLFWNDGTDDFYDLYMTLASNHPIITSVPNNRFPPTGDIGDDPSPGPGEVISPGERVDDNPTGGAPGSGNGNIPKFTVNIDTSGEVNTVYKNALELTLSYFEEIGGGTARTDTFLFDIYISSVFDNDNNDTARDTHDDLPDIEETDSQPEFESGEPVQEGQISLTEYATFSISDVEGTLSNEPLGISLSGGIYNATNISPGNPFNLSWNFNIISGLAPGNYSLDLEITYLRSDTLTTIIEYNRPIDLLVAPSTTVTGPIGGPANIADITIAYDMTGSPSTVDIYYTTDTSEPYSWIFIDADSTADGTYDWTIPSDDSYGWFAISDNETTPNSSSVPEASYYIYDSTPPEIMNTEPLHGSQGVNIDKDILITFNETIKTTSISYTLEPDPGSYSETWGNGNTVMTISHSDFLNNSRYWVNITAAKDLAGNIMNALPFSSYFDTVYVPSTATAIGPIGEPSNISEITILYSQTENPESVELYYTTNTSSPFIWVLIGEDNPADGSYSWNVPEDGYYGWYAKSPDESPPISTDAPQASYYIFDGSKPEILSTIPADMDVDVSLNLVIEIVFNEIMNTLTVENAFSYTDGQTFWDITQGTAIWNTNKDTMTFTPTFVLGYGTNYNVTITDEAKDLANNPLNKVYFWTFTTRAAPDMISPTVSSVSHIGENAEITNSITIMFSEAMNQTKVEESITISGGAGIQSFNWIGNTLTVTFADDLDHNSQYTVTIGVGAADLAGNPLSEPYTWTFTTKEKKEESISDNTQWLLILIIIVTVLIILVLIMKKGKPKQDKELEEIPEEESEVKIESQEDEVEEDT